MITTKAEILKLQMRVNRGDASIVGKISTGTAWPDGDHYYVIEDYYDQRTWHVLCSDWPK